MSETHSIEPDSSSEQPNAAQENDVLNAENYDAAARGSESYTADDMQHLDDREHVRLRPSM